MIVKLSSVAAVLVAGVVFAGPAAAIPACKDGVNAVGRAPLRLSSANGKTLAEKEAQRRAIAAWAKDVRARCGTHSPYWWRATGKSVTCESRAGGSTCRVSAVPAKKVL